MAMYTCHIEQEVWIPSRLRQIAPWLLIARRGVHHCHYWVLLLKSAINEAHHRSRSNNAYATG